MAAAGKRGIDISDLRARQFQAPDLDRFDYVLVMDRQNLADVKDIWQQNGGTEPALFLGFGRSAMKRKCQTPTTAVRTASSRCWT